MPLALPQLVEMGVAALKIEGRQRAAQPMYRKLVQVPARRSMPFCGNPHRYSVRPMAVPGRPGRRRAVTQGAYERPGNELPMSHP